MIELGAMFITVVALSFALSHLVLRFARRSHWLDIPNERSSHALPTPRGGGLAIVCVFYLALWLALYSNAIDISYFTALLAGLVVAGTGFIDDYRTGLSVRARLAFQIAAAVLAVGWLGGWPVLDLGFMSIEWGLVGIFIAIVGLVWLTNLFNFMDGIDGIAASEIAFAALLMAALGLTPIPPLLLAACAIGFLFVNWPPAKLFMGDVGSGFLGFTLGVIALHSMVSAISPPWPLLIAVGLFVTDATMTLLRRLARADKVWLAHRTHAYQWAARRYGSHRPVLLAAIALNILWLAPCAFAAEVFPRWAIAITCFAYAPLIALAWYFRAGEAELSHD